MVTAQSLCEGRRRPDGDSHASRLLAPDMTEQPSRNPGFLYRRGGNLLFFGLQAVIVLGIVLVVVNISDDKPRLPKSRDASFGDEVLVADNSVGCPTEEAYERWLNTTLEKGDENALEAAAREGCQLINSDTAGVVVKMSSRLPSGACVRPKGEPYCLWILDSRLSATDPSGNH